ncbi:carbohydrate ABC transporter permease [Paenibacillus sp. TAB 01]|uniref:carbohydrate ABC transporter permease n=1 Tax=Paenibacillus sp. TAB 01 TaxID=3368988 RepID=UPI003751F6F0
MVAQFRNLQAGRLPAATLKYLVLCSYLVLTVFPILWTFSNSFRTNDQIFTSIRLIPEQFSLENYRNLLESSNLLLAFYNSLSVTLLSLAGLIVCVVPLCFVLSRYKFRGSVWLYFYFILAIFIPSITLLASTFKIFQIVGFLGHQYPIAFVYISHQLPLSILLIASYMQMIPASLDEAAIIDGCGPWQLFSRIVLPLTQNGIVTVLILSFVNIWNDYIYALLLLPKTEFKTLTVALAAVKTEFAVSYGMVSAAVIIAVIPMMLFYLIVKERLMNGMVSGAVKG